MSEFNQESTKNWENNIYSKGCQINKWPFTDVVAIINNIYGKEDKKTLSVLEIGCGTGNNLWFFAEEGFRISGIDISPTPIQHAKEYIKFRGFHADLRVGDISVLPWEDASFDIILDRAALTHCDHPHIEKVLSEVIRILKPGGRMFCFTLFGMNTPDRILGKEVFYNSFDHFNGGLFEKAGMTSFFNASDLRHLFRNFKRIEICSTELKDEAGNLKIETFSVTAEK
jgi:ubiquinone/menaquinone biosynthesis C-methylase UbiE